MNERKIIISVIIIALLSVFQIIVNGKKNRRIRQLPLVILSAVLLVTGIYVWTKHMDAAAGFCQSYDFLTDGDLLFVNAALLLGFALLRLILCPVITALCKGNVLLNAFSMNLYQYDEEYGEWFLGREWINFRTYFFAIVCAMNLATGVFLGLTWVYGAGSPLWLMIFPCGAVAVFNETYNYINGQTKEEFVHSVMGDIADARRVSNFYKLREILEQLLPETLLSAYTGCEHTNVESAADYLKEKQDGGDTVDRITAEYFEISGRYKTVDVDRMHATFQIMHRHNVVFFNPFYRDLEMYITLPLVRTLLSGKKCVVLCGRRSASEDVSQWLTELLRCYSHMRTMWRVKALSDREPECEVGIIAFEQIYDKRVIDTNRTFLAETDFVLMVEPSVMLTTSQIALSILAEEMRGNEEPPVYCICDRYTDGLIDTLSHLLRTEITDVVAVPVPRCSYTGMSWNADGDFCRQQLFDKQTKYLGGGVELAAIAIKNQIPKVTWYSETKAPMKDVKWIAGQYYSTICRYMNQPSQQKKLYEKIEFVPNLWSPAEEKEQFLIVEDEFCNMFSMMRTYLSRGTTQTFVNILSENYLLRDYMRCNRQMFMSDPNAIPSLVPDYAKTERNVIMKLILMMSLRPVSEEEAAKEFRLVGIDTEDVFDTMVRLLEKYTFADSSLFSVHSVRSAVDELTIAASCVYSITDEEFEKHFSDSLKNAYYILENEKTSEGYIDAKLFSHITQTVLPGQFITYDGKYYIVKYVSPQSGVVLRRASDLFNGREYYRQVRTYYIDGGEGELVSIRKLGDVEFAEYRTDFHVDTTGYLEMRDCHDLRTAKLIDLSDDPSVSCFSRKYRNKSILRIRFPDADSKLQFTICMLLSEVFRSVFPEGWSYLAVVTVLPEDIGGMLNYMVYPVEGELDAGCIYIIEDSDIDLGLLNAVEKNFTRLMEIVADFLDWHLEKMREPAGKDPVPVKSPQAAAEETRKRGMVIRMLDRIRKLFGGKKEKPLQLSEEKTPESPVEEPAKKALEEAQAEKKAPPEYSLDQEPEKPDTRRTVAALSENGEETSAESPTKAEAPAKGPVHPKMGTTRAEQYPEDELMRLDEADPDLIHIDGTDIFDNEGMPEDNDYLEASFTAMGLTPITKSRYQRECFLKFGFEEVDERIQVDELRRYLRVRGWCNNALTQARKRESFAKAKIDLSAVDQCDFCGLPLSGVSFDRLSDGRVRCNDCSCSAISQVGDFRELFYRTTGMMENIYAIRFQVPISVKMTDARTIAKENGMVFKPSTRVAARMLGYAQRKGGKFSMMLENGSPRLATICTMTHELTHVWQYVNWKDGQVAGTYAMSSPGCTAFASDIVYEGMAVWAAIQYLYQIGETYYAAQQEALADARQDAYGIGFRLYKEQYPLIKDFSLLRYSPFLSFPPLEPNEVKRQVKARCGQNPCTC